MAAARAADDSTAVELDLFTDLKEEAGEPSGTGPTVRARLVKRPGRVVLIGGCAGVAVGAIVGAIWWVGAAAPSAARPPVSAASTPSAAPIVTLPGFAGSTVWTMPDVVEAAAAGTRVIALSGSTATVRDARSGKQVAEAQLSGQQFQVIPGRVAGKPAVAAVSTTQALVWVEGQNEAVTVSLSGGRSLQLRSGTFVIVGADRAFWLLTPAGEVPVVAPRPKMIVLGVEGDAVIWASATEHVMVASANGTQLSDAAIAAPAEGAQITPGTGWLKAASKAVTIVGWTLPDSQAVSVVYDTTSGAVLASIPGSGEGLLAPDGSAWVADGHSVSLTGQTATSLPAGFVPSKFLGGDLYGAVSDGRDALLTAGASSAAAVPASTAQPLAATDGALVTLTGTRLAIFLPSTTIAK